LIFSKKQPVPLPVFLKRQARLIMGNFIDYLKIYLKSGNGGAGSVHFRKEKYVPHGGPDGGDGGRGGHVILKGNSNLWTLLHLRYRKHIKASSGQAGMGGNKTGADGQDEILEVPLGTQLFDAETEELICEVTEHNQVVTALSGGRGGLGNTNFKSSTNQAPVYAQPGEEGTEGWFVMELKLLADVGLVGFPNAGKSTLLSVVSAAKPKIADYAFTTLVPNLGVVSYRDNQSFVMADIPGIIEGAAEGKGLGIRFLRHIERNATLLFMISCDTENIRKEYETLVKELRDFNPELLDKPRLLAITKSDMLDDELKEEISKELPELPYVFISSVANQGITELKDKLWQMMQVDEIGSF
jgi:GTP-binding protein